MRANSRFRCYVRAPFFSALVLHVPLPKVIKRRLTYQTLETPRAKATEERERGSTFHRMAYTGRRVGGRVLEGLLSTTGRSCGEGVVGLMVSSYKIPTSITTFV
jgi:hypothetical protein